MIADSGAEPVSTMRWMLVESDWQQSTTVIRTFRDGKAAHDAYAERERELFPWDGSAKVCLFRCESVKGLRNTHGSWFHESVTVDGRVDA